jgi:hypothetical protein
MSLAPDPDMDGPIASGHDETGGEMAHAFPPVILANSVRDLKSETKLCMAVSRHDWVSFACELPLSCACMGPPLL